LFIPNRNLLIPNSMAPCLEHGISRRSRCRQCGHTIATGICEHNRRKRRCPTCKPSGYLYHITGVRTRSALKSNKHSKAIEYLGCTVQQFKEHIEKQFVEGMNWCNIQIDHCVPIMYNNPSEDEIIKRLHFTNTQPLFERDNMSKGSRFVSGRTKSWIASLPITIEHKRLRGLLMAQIVNN